MTRHELETQVAVPIVINAGGVAGIFVGFGAGVLLALLVCIAVCCTNFGDGTKPAGDVMPSPTTSSCEPFCVPATEVLGGAR
ncbi:hypothetical protein [Nocardia sp. alder85J]|uniref:hypothetical protein n=1 Tax=Nocardia sp. alder85J TaxID=2862949 RepID=UPI001CD41435|nr:hypothetical protein [Nocardia sp. alder85J]MCX4099215.1 hypothetical protein [Nocardia sp. alder85J]